MSLRGDAETVRDSGFEESEPREGGSWTAYLRRRDPERERDSTSEGSFLEGSGQV